ncbi:hypothetical protein GGS20DRAFT_403086 [Poronia punctata]|nr:hypothetical protein GGS20DRAFT_403086 [Poronia punctata]
MYIAPASSHHPSQPPANRPFFLFLPLNLLLITATNQSLTLQHTIQHTTQHTTPHTFATYLITVPLGIRKSTLTAH